MDISSAPGATHISVKTGWSKVDFAMGEFETSISNTVNFPIGSTAVNVNLTHAAAPTLATGKDVFVLLIEFFQEVNGKQYPLRNGGYNSLAVIEIV